MTKRKTNKIDELEEDLSKIDPKTLERIKSQIKDEVLKDTSEFREDFKKKRAVEKRFLTQYSNRMKGSEVPWFQLVVLPPNDPFEVGTGLNYTIDWNDPFQQLLVSTKTMGSDDLDRTENWLIELLHTIIERREAEKGSASDFE